MESPVGSHYFQVNVKFLPPILEPNPSIRGYNINKLIQKKIKKQLLNALLYFYEMADSNCLIHCCPKSKTQKVRLHDL